MDKHSDISDLDRLKQVWSSQRFKTPQGSPDVSGCERLSGYTQQLCRRYHRAAILGLIMALMVWPLNSALELPMPLCICLSVFFLIMSAVQGSYWLEIRDLEFGEMSLTEAVKRVVSLRKSMLVRVVAGVCLAVPLLCALLLHYMTIDVYMFYGGIAGAIAGLMIGYVKLRDSLRIIRKMERTITDAS